jgi:hypothetical protein
MDVRGAEHLRRAIEQQEHWRQAAAVCDGRQSQRDPDAAELVELKHSLRRYRSRNGFVFEKRLLDGSWV